MQFRYLEILFYIMAAIFLLGSSFVIMKGYERAVIFRLGKYLKKILDQLKDMGCEFFSMSGGEPFLREDIFDLCDYAHKKGIRVRLATNGQAVEDNLLTLEKARFDSLVLSGGRTNLSGDYRCVTFSN